MLMAVQDSGPPELAARRSPRDARSWNQLHGIGRPPV